MLEDVSGLVLGFRGLEVSSLGLGFGAQGSLRTLT